MRGTAVEVLALLHEWEAAEDPGPLVVQTSGSTGSPKRVLLSRAAMRASADATHARLGGPGQWLLNLPPSYVAGLQVLFRSVRAGTRPVVQDGSFEDAAAAMTGERRYVSLVPTQLVRLLEVDALRGFDSVLVGGARLDAPVRDRAERAGASVVATYGMSETCGGCVYDGRPLDGVEVRVGADGRIRIAGRVLFDGYDGRPDLTAGALEDGWFVTQDLGRLDQDGLLQVVGRVDDVVLSGGVNVPPAAVASRLREHPSVREAEVVGIPDPEWGRRRRRGAGGGHRSRRGPGLGGRGATPSLGTPSRRPGRCPAVAAERQARPACRRPAGRGERRPRPGSTVTAAQGEVFAIGMRTRFRGITVREGMLLRGDAGWGEFSPFPEYDARTARPWLRAAQEAADVGWPAPVRESVPVNVTVPAVGPTEAAEIVRGSNGCRTAKVKVGEPGQSLGEEQARLEAVRDALGPDGLIRIDVNGAWSVDEAVTRIPLLERASGGLEYVEQPTADVEGLAAVRRLVETRVAADESIRRAEDPYRVRELEAADVAVLKVQPLGGVRACLRIAEDIGLPVVVSSALETSVGIAAGVALAAALPELHHACGLATVQLLLDDVAVEPLVPLDGELPVVRPEVDPVALLRTRAPADRERHWRERLMEIGQDHSS